MRSGGVLSLVCGQFRELLGQGQRAAIIGNTVWLFCEKVLRMIVGLFVNIWVARYLGPSQFGLLSYAGSFVALFAAVASLGLDGIVVRNIVRDVSRRNEILGTAFFLKAAASAVTLLVAIGMVSLVRPGDTLSFWLVGASSTGLLFQAFDVIDFHFQAEVCSKYTAFAKSCAFVLVAAGKVALILIDAPLVLFGVAAASEVILGAVGLALIYKLKGLSFKGWRFTAGCARQLLADSWPLVFSGLVIMIYMRIDQLMIANLKGDAEVGIYAAAVSLAEIWYFLPTIIVSSVFPSVIAAHEEGEELLHLRLQKLYNLMALLGYLVAIPTTLLAGWAVSFLYGYAYSAAGPMLGLLVWAGLFVNLGVARSAFLTTKNWTRLHFMTVFAGAIINVAANFVLIPLYGGMGAVIASCLAYWFAAHGACYLYVPLRKTGSMMTRALLFPRIW